MHRKRIIAIGGFLVISALVVVYVVLATYDYNKFKPRLARMVKDATGRELRLDGELKLALGLAPALVASHAALANAPWGSQPDMIKVENLRLQARLLPLLLRTVELTHISLAGVEVLLETDAKERHNWDFKVAAEPGNKGITASDPLKLALDHISITNLVLAFRPGQNRSTKRFHLKRLDLARQGDGDIQVVDLKAEYNGKPIAITGSTGAIEQLWASQSFPIKLSGTYAGATATLDGKIDQILQLKGVDLDLKVSGRELAELGPLLATNLPAMGAFDARGRLTGSATALAMYEFEARIEISDFKGRSKIERRRKP